MVEEGSFMHAVFWPSFRCIRVGPQVLSTCLPKDKERAHTAFAGVIALCGNIFPCFRFNVCSFSLLKHVCQWLSGILQLSVCQTPWQRGWGFLLWYERDIHWPFALQGLPAMKDLCSLLELILLCLLCETRDALLFTLVWVLLCVSLGNPNTKMQWAKVFGVLLWDW